MLCLERQKSVFGLTGGTLMSRKLYMLKGFKYAYENDSRRVITNTIWRIWIFSGFNTSYSPWGKKSTPQVLRRHSKGIGRNVPGVTNGTHCNFIIPIAFFTVYGLILHFILQKTKLNYFCFTFCTYDPQGFSCIRLSNALVTSTSNTEMLTNQSLEFNVKLSLQTWYTVVHRLLWDHVVKPFSTSVRPGKFILCI